MENNFFELMQAEQQKFELAKVLECNEKTRKFGLELSWEEANNLVLSCKETLADNRRVELGEGILPKIIHYFCDSQYIYQDNYVDTLEQLQEIFYLFKNETDGQLTDDELLDFMRQQFEEVCYGDLDYLSNTCLERYAKAIRSGKFDVKKSRLRDEYSLTNNENQYSEFSEETRWDYEVYKMKLDDLF